jgi:hypothetical protein
MEMTTLHRRRQWRDKHEPGFTDIALAFNAGFWTAAICALVLVTLWR